MTSIVVCPDPPMHIERCVRLTDCNGVDVMCALHTGLAHYCRHGRIILDLGQRM